MSDRRWRLSPLSFLVPLLLASSLVAAWLAATWPRPGPGPAEPAPVAAPAAPERVAPAAADRDPAREPPARELALPVAVAPPPTFAERIDELVRIGQRTAELAGQDDTAAATASDQRARAQFADLMTAFPDAGERALDLLITLPDGPPEPMANGRRIVLQLVLAAECERREHDAQAAGERSRADALVQALLDVMPGTAITAEVGEHVLGRQRYLRLAHEPAVLRLVQLAAAEQFSRRIATSLLLTLWDNLQAFGERSSDELSRLALLLLADTDASQRTAACRQLLRDPRYRGLVIAWLAERSDRAVAHEVAGIAARELPVADALAVLRELSATLPHAPNAYLVLGFRAPEALADSYRELLAANTHPDVRRDLVTGVGMMRTPIARELAELALHDDPEIAVRLQAVFALTAQGLAEPGERALSTALDDPRIANDPVHLGAIVLALQNLEAAGDANAIERIAQRLRSLPLAATSREQLAALVRRSVPGQGAGAAPR